ncbi:MAG: glycosyltransferase family 9 protein [Paracoccaceae bacterium]
MAERGNRSLRAADQSLGPAILGMLGLFRRRRALPDAPRRIGLLCVGALGDLLLFSSVIPALRARFPAAEVVTFGSDGNAAIAAMLDLGTFVRLPITRPDQAARAIRAAGCDLLIDSTQWANLPPILAALSGAATVGFATSGARRRSHDRTAPHSNAIHEIENFRNLARLTGAGEFAAPALRLDAKHHEAAARVASGDYAVIHAWPAGTRSELKAWANENWAAVAAHLAGRGLDVVLTGGPADLAASAGLAQAIGARARVIDTAGRLRLPETAALLAGARVNLSVNTGVMHIAAAVDRPLIALHGPTNPRRWGPISARAIDIAPPGEGCGYLNMGFEYPEAPPDCMGRIRPETVIAAIETALS